MWILLFFFFWHPDAEKTPFPDFFTAQIQEDLGSIQISEQDMEISWQTAQNEECIRYKFLNNQLTAASKFFQKTHPRYVVVTQALEAILAKKPWPDLDFIICLGDGLISNETPAPIFTFAKQKGGSRLILIPDCEALNPADRNYISSVILKGAKEFPWEQKKNLVFWRGAATGSAPTIEQLASNCLTQAPRFQLVDISQKLPELVDAAFVSWNCNSNNRDLFIARFRLTSAVHPHDHLLYKYLIDLDGNTCCYSRTYWVLLSNSLMLKQTTNNIQWFYKGLQPFVHFVPLRQDLSDLQEKLIYCKNNDSVSRSIAQNGTDFALKHLQYEHNLDYMANLLAAYKTHLTYQPTIQDGDLPATPPLYRRVYFQIKGFLRKLIKKQPIASALR